MAETRSCEFGISAKKRAAAADGFEGDDDIFVAKKSMLPTLAVAPPSWESDPAASLASLRHEFGEHGGVNMSIEASATFTVMEPETMRRMFTGELGPDRDFFIYSRHFNPTVLNLGRQMAALEGTEAAYCTASGMAAISSVKLQLCSSDGHVVASATLYGGTHALLTHFLPRICNITTTFVDITDHEAVKNAIVQGRTNVLFFESMSNPTLTVANIPELSKLAHDKGATSAVCGPESLLNSMMDLHQGSLMLLGPTMNAKVAFELSERIPHLGLRKKEHCLRAMEYATRMKKMGQRVVYPGLEDHPQHHLLKSMANKGYGFGGLLCVDMELEEKATRLMHHLQNSSQFGLIAVSLGYYETLMSCSGSSTSSELNSEEKALAGISPGLVRMSIGYTGTLEQKWSQFERAISRMEVGSTLFNKN
ncbi:hypothetical protein ES319_A09G198500v1 [Gossypium barbadense]|uniref:Methionine gamma-lyase n=1 Tax=Gossypium barbadense TaxID=3634 RepID=A0A5J5UGR1_GOSBA|nr:hypothetical protein ES319_A09G198500v1 [Gossypium barbadense]